VSCPGDAVAAERARVARVVHDELVPLLSAALLRLDLRSSEADDELAAVRSALVDAVGALHDLQRSLAGPGDALPDRRA
jgi:hypothetical protein